MTRRGTWTARTGASQASPTSVSLLTTLTSSLQQQGVPHDIAQHVGTLRPVSSLFAAVLGVNLVAHLLAPSGTLSALPQADQQILTGRAFFSAPVTALTQLAAQYGVQLPFATREV